MSRTLHMLCQAPATLLEKCNIATHLVAVNKICILRTQGMSCQPRGGAQAQCSLGQTNNTKLSQYRAKKGRSGEVEAWLALQLAAEANETTRTATACRQRDFAKLAIRVPALDAISCQNELRRIVLWAGHSMYCFPGVGISVRVFFRQQGNSGPFTLRPGAFKALVFSKSSSARPSFCAAPNARRFRPGFCVRDALWARAVAGTRILRSGCRSIPMGGRSAAW